MKCITTLKKLIGFSFVHLLLLQPLLLGSSIARAESAASRVRSRKIAKQPVSRPAIIEPVAAVHIEQDEQDLRKPRSIAGRKEEKGGFEKNVEAYAARVKNTYGLKDPGIKPFADAIQKVKSHDSLVDIRKIVSPLRVAASQAEQHLGVALLLKASLPLGKQEREIICEVLHKLDGYISYWREQKHHSIKYFFHKSPQKWFMGQKQKHEIEENISFLMSARDTHLRLLTKLSNHENAFNPESSIEEQYRWLAKYLSTINSVCFAKKPFKVDDLISYQNSHAAVCELLASVPNHEHIINTALGNARKPGHFTRNWLRYTGFAIGSLMFASYANRNQEKFYNWFNTDVKGGAANIWGGVTGNVRAFYEVFIGKDKVRSEQQAPQPGQPAADYNLRRDIDGRLVDVRDRVHGVRDELNNAVVRLRANAPQNVITQAEALAQCQAAVNAYQQTRAQLVGQALVPDAAPHNIQAVQFADLKPAIRRVFNAAFADMAHVTAQVNVPQAAAPGLAAPAVGVGAANPIPNGLIRGRLGEPLANDIDNHLAQIHHFMQHHLPQIRNILNNEVPAYQRTAPAIVALGGHITNLGQAYLLLYEMDGGNIVGVGADVVGQLANLIETVEQTVEPLRIGVGRGIELTESVEQIITQNKATAILAALFPAVVVIGGTGFGATKLYKALKYKPEYQPIREALIDIGHLLNEEGIAKSPEQEELDQGKIIYLVWKLEREAHNVPVLQRDQFKADVSRLGKNDTDRSSGKRVWTSDKKLRIIDLMYRTYDFLNPTYVVQ